MKDKELLEFAAKAADIGCNVGMCGDSYQLPENWNPLTNDGDALRLAVKLNMDLTFCTNGDMHAECIGSEYACENLTNRNEATRRAIVRAAAEIGAQMK